MKEFPLQIVPYTADHAWWHMLARTVAQGTPCDGGSYGKSHEVVGTHSMIEMTYPVVTDRNRKLNYNFMCQEALWILKGLNSITGNMPEWYRKYAPEDNEHIQWAYGPKFVEQVNYVVDTLVRDPMSRQAVLTLWRENPRYAPPCTLSLQFLLRRNQIDLVVSMRSSDLWLGWPYDVYAFTMMTWYVALTIIKVCPSMRERIHTLGVMHMMVGSTHIYDKYKDRVQQVIDGGKCDKFFGIQLYSVNTPEHLLECLGYAKECLISNNDHFNSITKLQAAKTV